MALLAVSKRGRCSKKERLDLEMGSGRQLMRNSTILLRTSIVRMILKQKEATRVEPSTRRRLGA